MNDQPEARSADFWQDFLAIPLPGDNFGPGLFRIDLTTAKPIYADLWLEFDDSAYPSLFHSFDALEPTRFSALLRLDRACSHSRIIITPPGPADIVLGVSVRRLGPASQLLLGLRKVLGNLGNPKLLFLKLRHVMFATGNIRLKTVGSLQLDAADSYARWQEIFETRSELERLRAALRLGRGTNPPQGLAVYASASTALPGLISFLDVFGGVAHRANDAHCQPHLLVIKNAEFPLPAALRQRIMNFGGEIVAEPGNQISIPVLETAVRRVGASYFIVLDRPGRLPPWAFDAFALEFARHPDALMVYADSDQLAPDGKRVEPSFKPEWSPEFLLASNYIRAPVVFSAAVLTQTARENLARPKAASLELALSMMTSSARPKVHRIPRVLFHELPKDLNEAGRENTYREEYEVVGEWLAEQGQRRSLSRLEQPARPDIRYIVDSRKQSLPRVSVVLLTKDHPELLEDSARSVLDADYPYIELVVIDNGSKSSTQHDLLATLAGETNVVVDHDDRPFNFSKLNNCARQECTGDVLLFLNDDTKSLNRNWLREMATLAILPDVGCVGALLLYADGSVQHAGVTLGIGGLAGHSFRHANPDDPNSDIRLHARREVSAVTGACLAVRASVFDEVGGFDEDLAVALNDVDLCLKVRRRGYRNMFTPHAVLTHYESATRGMDTSPERLARLAKESATFFRTWGAGILDDPFYSPHLSRNAEDYRPRVAG